MNREKIIVGFSGGVDSTAAAMLLKNEGYEVFAVTFDFFGDTRSLSRAKALAKEVGIHHEVINHQTAFRQRVIEPFVQDYMKGLTPNPCIRCDKVMKFSGLFDYADEKGVTKVATGHYLNIEEDHQGFHLHKNSNDRKDQSYFLYTLTQKRLKRLLFPLGGFTTKEDVRQYLQDFGIEVPPSEESQGICFIPHNHYGKFIKRYTPLMQAGRFRSIKGTILGSHQGFYYFTLGQKKGLGTSFNQNYSVVAIIPETNEVILGDEADLYKTEIPLQTLDFILEPPRSERVYFKVCRFGPLYEGALSLKGKDVGTLKSKEPVRAPAPGQSVVFYDGTEILGGGIIAK